MSALEAGDTETVVALAGNPDGGACSISEIAIEPSQPPGGLAHRDDSLEVVPKNTRAGGGHNPRPSQ